MKNKPNPALCRDCKHQKIRSDSDWTSVCLHPKVNAKNAWALANSGGNGTLAGFDAVRERERTSFFAPCGQAGKLWEPKIPDNFYIS